MGLKIIEYLITNKNKIRNRDILIFDIVVFLITPFLALYLRFEGSYNFLDNINQIAFVIFLFGCIKFTSFYLGNIYRKIWSLAGVDELNNLIFTGASVVGVQFLAFVFLKITNIVNLSALPLSLPILDGIITMIFTSAIRFSLRIYNRTEQNPAELKTGKNVLIIGAGDAGLQVASEIQKNLQGDMKTIGFIDDDPEKQNKQIKNIPVLGNKEDIKWIVVKYKIQKIIIAIPSASGDIIRELNNICQTTGAETQTLPGIFDIIGGNVSINKLRNIDIEDLLRREPVRINTEQVSLLLKNKTILITGAGGSIGSEICRQVSRYRPKSIILIGHGENSIFEIEQEIKYAIYKNGKDQMNFDLIPLIADIRDYNRLNRIFDKYRPDIVFHAAAHKHVPLMEGNPSEAIRNNIWGTKNLVEISDKYGVNNFVLISTDKAVNPTSVMGTSKRIAEMVLLNSVRKNNNNFVAVRFGNVLGSRGSVIRTFQQQLKRGGPITITHPEIVRYFMTIPEAVQLVLQAYALGSGGEVFLADMGEPVKISDLAKDMIRLAGLKEGIDVEIKYTGLRPGEKLYEELFVQGEEYERTIHKKILIAKNASSFLPEDFEEALNDLINNIDELMEDEIIDRLKLIVPEFRATELNAV